MPSTIPPDWIITHVPADVWRLIFGIRVAGDLHNSPGFTRSKAPIVLIRVCWTWRKIALSSPELWCKIALHNDSGGHAFPPQEFLNRALTFARGLPLNMHILSCDGGELVEDYCQAASALLESVHRARYLELNVEVVKPLINSPGFFKVVGSNNEEMLLEELVFSRPIGHEYSSSRRCILRSIPLIAKIWTPAPMLHTLIVRDKIKLDDSWEDLVDGRHFPFHQLTTLELESEITVPELFSVLSATPNLVKCKVDKIIWEDGDEDFEDRDEPLLLPALRRLDLGGLWWEDEEMEQSPPLTQFLGYIITPSLISLRLHDYDRWPMTSFASFIHNSSCHIIHLVLDVIGTTETEKLELLRLLPFLQSLKMVTKHKIDYGGILFNAFMDALRDWDEEKGEFCLCPTLESIDVDYSGLLDPWNTIFADMIEVRWRKGKYKRLVVRNPVDIDIDRLWSQDLPYFPAEFIRLLILKRDGLNVVLDDGDRIYELERLICR